MNNSNKELLEIDIKEDATGKTTNKLGVFFVFIMIFGSIFGSSSPNGFCLGDGILETIGLKAWSTGTTGTHYSEIFSLILIIIAWTGINQTFGKRYPEVTRIVMSLLFLLFLIPIIVRSLKFY